MSSSIAEGGWAMTWSRYVLGIGLLVVVFATTACRLFDRGERELALPEGVQPEEVIDKDYPDEIIKNLSPASYYEAAESIRDSRKPKELPEKKYNILCLSGGGVYGAYSAGVLAGWTASGQRPVFDVVTGISTGALIAPRAFLGSEYDRQLQIDYTTITNDDVFKRRRFSQILSESVADSAPLRSQIEKIATPQILERIAVEHKKGRRLYIGSTNIDTKRLVVWDIGEICVKKEAGWRELVINVLLASSAIPGFFPPIEIPVNIDGRQYRELHVDGGMTREVFMRLPYIEPDKREVVDLKSFWNSNLYILIAGKLYADPMAVRRRTLQLASTAISGLLYTTTRGDIDRLFNFTLITGMNLYISAIPNELEVTTNATDFDPVEMTKMFNEGYKAAVQGVRRMGSDGKPTIGPAWQDRPPGLARKSGEAEYTRGGTHLTVRKDPTEPDRNPEQKQSPNLPGVTGGNGQSAIPVSPIPIEK